MALNISKSHFPIINKDGEIVKPKGCSFCSLAKRVGFVPDGFFQDPLLTEGKVNAIKLLVVQEMPSKDEANLIKPLAGNYGYSRWKRFFEKSGWQIDEVGFSYIRRCYAGMKDGKAMLNAAETADAGKKCRQFDVLYPAFSPTVALVTCAFADSIKTPAFYRMTLADLTKARLLTQRGERVILLMGTFVRQHFLPSLTGDSAAWGGSYFSL